MHHQRDVKDVVGTLMFVCGGGEVTPDELADIGFEAEGELETILNEAWVKLKEFANDRALRESDPQRDKAMRAGLQDSLDRIVKACSQYTTVANASWEWAKIGYIASGEAGAFPEEDPSDVLVDLIYALKAGYRQNGHFVMNRKTQSEVRKFKDTGGAYLWQPPAAANGHATLMTFPLVEAEDMPDIAANSYSIAFGDFRRGYLIVDRQGVRVLRDPYTAKPYVLFYTTNVLTDAWGDRYYNPGGHHEMPKGVYRHWDLRPETRRVFDQGTTGTLPDVGIRTTPEGRTFRNAWRDPGGGLHKSYNDAVGELSDDFLKRNRMAPEQMTPDHARALLKEIRESEDPRIRDFNNNMRRIRRLFRLRPGPD